jgi:hypothetical protein
MVSYRRVGASRALGNLPTIEEDKSDDSLQKLSKIQDDIVKVSELLNKPKL